MTDADVETLQKKPPTNRLIWGIILLVVGFLSPLLIPWVLSMDISDGLKTVISGGLAFGIPELFMLFAVGVMGKSGFNYLKRYMRLVMKVYGPPQSVSKMRYKVGLVLFVVPLVIGFITPYVLYQNAFYMDHALVITLSTDFLFFMSLLVLGGEFWDKLRSLFVYGASANFPEKSNQTQKS